MILKEYLKKFCKLADLDYKSNDTKDDLKEIVENYLNKYKYAPRYLRGLSKDEIFEKKFDIKYNYLLEKKTRKPYYKEVSTDYKNAIHKRLTALGLADEELTEFLFNVKINPTVARVVTINGNMRIRLI